jgi:hypothetical protein
MALETTLAQHFYVPKLSNISKTACERCSLCAKNNPQQEPRVPPQVQNFGGTSFENLIVAMDQRIQIFTGVCLHLLRIGGSLPHLD